MNRRLLYIFTAVSFTAFSCGDSSNVSEVSESESPATEESDESFQMEDESAFQFDLIIANNIAAPVKLLTDMNRAGLDHYRENITNPTDQVASYVTSDEKALGFGVYGADLSYNSLYGQHQEMADYIIAIRNLAEELGLVSLFDQEAYERFNRIKTDPDSVRLFIFEKYDLADEYLRANDRLMTATLILTGGLVESLHLISSQIEVGDTNKEAYMIFLGQKNTLKSLLELYETLESEGQDVAIKKDIELLYQQFEDLDSMEKFSKENVHNLHVAIDKIRDQMI